MNDELSNITPSSLINGYGYNVVVILSHFVDCSLRAVKFETRSTLHSNGLDQISDNNHVTSLLLMPEYLSIDALFFSFFIG